MDFKENKGCGERLPFSAKLFCGRIQWGKLRLCPSCKNNSSSAVSKDKDKEPDDGGARTDSGSDFKLSDKVFVQENRSGRKVVMIRDIKEFIRRRDILDIHLKTEVITFEEHYEAKNKLTGKELI